MERPRGYPTNNLPDLPPYAHKPQPNPARNLYPSKPGLWIAVFLVAFFIVPMYS